MLFASYDAHGAQESQTDVLFFQNGVELCEINLWEYLFHSCVDLAVFSVSLVRNKFARSINLINIT